MKLGLIALALTFSTPVFADADQSAEERLQQYKREIIARCKDQMGAYGASLVKTCVDEDLKALFKLSKMPEKHASIVSRCLGQMREYGFSLVLTCAEQDIKAQEALDNY